jgi:hypothetical protein
LDSSPTSSIIVYRLGTGTEGPQQTGMCFHVDLVLISLWRELSPGSRTIMFYTEEETHTLDIQLNSV